MSDCIICGSGGAVMVWDAAGAYEIGYVCPKNENCLSVTGVVTFKPCRSCGSFRDDPLCLQCVTNILISAGIENRIKHKVVCQK